MTFRLMGYEMQRFMFRVRRANPGIPFAHAVVLLGVAVRCMGEQR